MLSVILFAAVSSRLLGVWASGLNLVVDMRVEAWPSLTCLLWALHMNAHLLPLSCYRYSKPSKAIELDCSNSKITDGIDVS